MSRSTSLSFASRAYLPLDKLKTTAAYQRRAKTWEPTKWDYTEWEECEYEARTELGLDNRFDVV